MRHHYALAAVAATIGLAALAYQSPYALREVIAAMILFTLGFAVFSVFAGISVLVGLAGKKGTSYARTKVRTGEWQAPELFSASAQIFNKSFQHVRAIQWVELWNTLKQRLSIPTANSPIQ